MLPYTPATVAELLFQQLDRAAAARGRCSLAIPGGRSPGPVLSELAARCTPFVRERLCLLWVDERALPPGHAERNDLPTLAAWDAGGPRPARVLPMPAEEPDLDAAAARYAASLAEVCSDDRIDAVLLGLGEDGHVASLFPAHPALDEFDPVLAITDSPKPPPRRLTMSLGLLRQAGLRAVLALGAAKGPPALAALRGGADPQIPASLLGACHWFLDEAAEAALRSTS